MLLMLVLLALAMGISPVVGLAASVCVDCHKSVTPNIVTDWEISKHGQIGMDCSICHGSRHNSPSNVADVQIPTPDTCAAAATKHDQIRLGHTQPRIPHGMREDIR